MILTKINRFLLGASEKKLRISNYKDGYLKKHPWVTYMKFMAYF